MRFSLEQVRRARTERQAAHVLSVRCPRCHAEYWIRARDIAESTLDADEARASRLDVATEAAVP